MIRTPGRLTRLCIIPREIDSMGYYTPGRLTRRVIIPREISPQFLTIDFPGYDTPGRLTCWGIIPRWNWLTGVSHPVEIDLPGYHIPGDWLVGYHTLGSHVLVDFLLTRWGMILWGDWLAWVSNTVWKVISSEWRHQNVLLYITNMFVTDNKENVSWINHKIVCD